MVNKIRGTFKCVAVKAPGFGERRKAMLEDIAILTGGQVITEEVGLKLENTDARDAWVRARQVLSSPRTRPPSSKVLATDEQISGRVNQIKAEIENSDSDYDREKLQERLAKLSGGVAVIKVGAATEVELKEKKHRIEDAVSTTKAAVEEGVVARRWRCAAACIRTRVREAAESSKVTRPLAPDRCQAADRGPAEADRHQRRPRRRSCGRRRFATLEPGHGLNAATGEYEDLFAAGIIDAAKVTRSALQNAASIAGLFLTTEAVIVDKPEKAAPAAPGGDGGMGGMDF